MHEIPVAARAGMDRRYDCCDRGYHAFFPVPSRGLEGGYEAPAAPGPIQESIAEDEVFLRHDTPAAAPVAQADVLATETKRSADVNGSQTHYCASASEDGGCEPESAHGSADVQGAGQESTAGGVEAGESHDLRRNRALTCVPQTSRGRGQLLVLWGRLILGLGVHLGVHLVPK